MDCQQLLSVSQGLLTSKLYQVSIHSRWSLPSRKEPPGKWSHSSIWIKRRNAEWETDFEDWERLLANLRASQDSPWLCMLRAMPHVPGKSEAIAALGQSQHGWPGCVPASPLQIRGQWGNNSSLELHMFAVPARATQRTLPPEAAPLMTSGEERAGFLIALKRSISASIQWLMVEQDNKASQDENRHRKATWSSPGNWNF